MTSPSKTSRGSGLRGALLVAVLLGLLLPASALAAPPETTIDSGPADGSTTNDPTPNFTFSADDPAATFECLVDDAPVACSGPGPGPGNHTITPALADGTTHTFRVQAVNAVPETGPPKTRTFTVDTQAPETTIDTGPGDGGTTSNPNPSFTFSSNDSGATFQCSVDSVTVPCSDPGPGPGSHTITPALDPDGTYTFEVWATDAAGNVDPTHAARTFTVDTTPPDTTIVSGPEGPTNNRNPSFSFSSEPGASFECRLDGPGAATEVFAPCSNPKSYTGNLADGNYTFRVRAIDGADNTDPDPDTQSFTVDTTAPKTTIDSGPTGTTSDTTPTFTFSSDEGGSTFQCRIDNAPFGACSGPGEYTASPLADGNHTFAVRARDPASNLEDSPANQAFVVDSTLPPDTTPPDLKISKRPKGKIKTKKKTARVAVSFSSEPGATYRCKLDRGEYKPCTSPYRVKAKAGAGRAMKHAISVRAADEAGNIGKPAVIKFQVLRKLRLKAPVARRTVTTALERHDFARRVVRSVDVDCSRRSQVVFACRFSTRFSGYRLKGKGKIKLGKDLSYRFRVVAQGVHFTLTDENEQRSHRITAAFLRTHGWRA